VFRNGIAGRGILKVLGGKIMSAKNKRNQDDLGTNSAGQSGDTQQISDVAGADSESVAELVEEGNAFEADAIEGVENAKDPDVSEVTTREVPEDDVPQEYLDDDEHVA
jgi:N utilization substance protein A